MSLSKADISKRNAALCSILITIVPLNIVLDKDNADLTPMALSLNILFDQDTAEPHDSKTIQNILLTHIVDSCIPNAVATGVVAPSVQKLINEHLKECNLTPRTIRSQGRCFQLNNTALTDVLLERFLVVSALLHSPSSCRTN